MEILEISKHKILKCQFIKCSAKEFACWLCILNISGLEMRKSKMKCQIDPPMNSRAKQIGKSPVWQFLFNGMMHKSSFAIQGI